VTGFGLAAAGFSDFSDREGAMEARNFAKIFFNMTIGT